MIERRILPLELREEVTGSKGRQRWATAVTYGTVDSYGSTWRPGVFTEALAERMPTVLYGHDWWNLDHVLGQGIDSREADYGVDVLMEFADPDKIAAARTAIELISGDRPVLRDVSVGFERREWVTGTDLTDEERAMGASEAFIKAGMDELSLVVRGAVPGASMRHRAAVHSGVVDLDAVVEIAQRKAAGELTDAEAKAAVDLLVTGVEPPPAGGDTAGGDTGDGGDDGGGEDDLPDHSELLAELDTVLGS